MSHLFKWFDLVFHKSRALDKSWESLPNTLKLEGDQLVM